jgi:hypothetical protein
MPVKSRTLKSRRGGFWPFTSSVPNEPSALESVGNSVSKTLTAAKDAVVGTTVVAKDAASEMLPPTLTNSQAAGRRLKTAKGDKMLGGRRRRNSKKSRKHSRRR